MYDSVMDDFFLFTLHCKSCVIFFSSTLVMLLDRTHAYYLLVHTYLKAFYFYEFGFFTYNFISTENIMNGK